MDIDQLMRAVAIVLAVTAIAVSIARRLNLGSTLGLLVVGAALGPHSPHPLLGFGHVDELQAIGEIGIVLLLFLLGLDIRPARLWAMRGMVVGLGTAQYVLSTAAIAGVLLLQGVGERRAGHRHRSRAGDELRGGRPGRAGRARDTGNLEGRATIAVQILQSFVLIALLTVIPLLGATERAASIRRGCATRWRSWASSSPSRWRAVGAPAPAHPDRHQPRLGSVRPHHHRGGLRHRRDASTASASRWRSAPSCWGSTSRAPSTSTS